MYSHVVVSLDQNEGQNHIINTINKTFERAEHFKYFETTLMKENSIHEEIKGRLKLRIA